MKLPPRSIIDLAEAFTFFATIASGVKHFVKIELVGQFGPMTLAQVCIAHGEPLPPEWCEECLAMHGQPLPMDAGFTLTNPPLPTPDRVFVNPDGGEIQPQFN